MTDAPLLVIDAGNTRWKVALVRGGGHGLPEVVRATAFAAREPDAVARLTRWVADQERPRGVLIGGADPSAIEALREGLRRTPLKPVHLGPPSEELLPNRTAAPERVGPDRLFDAVATNRIRPRETPAVVIDSGTATTVNLIDRDGAFLGGAILAGFELLAAALHEKTALLPRIDALSFDSPADPVGRDTTSAIRSGLYWGLVGSVKELTARLSETTETSPTVVLTGGAAPLLAPHLPSARHEPYLTLQGMALTAEFALQGGER